MKIGGVILILLAILFSCQKDENTPYSLYFGYEYFPVQVGNYAIYEVVDIFHDVAIEPAHDTSIYQIKEFIAESFLDNEGDTIHKLRRYRRENESQPWVIQDIWTLKITDETAEVVEENDRYLKLVFPISSTQKWNSNALNNEPMLIANYENLHQPYSINSMSFDSTVTVEKENFISLIDYRRNYEIYAVGVGRIKSVFKDLKIADSDTLSVTKGPELHYTLLEFGHE